MLSKWFRGCCGCSRVYLGHDYCRNPQFGSPILHICLTEVVRCVPPSRLRQFVKPHLLLPKTLYALWYWFGDWAHHPARFVVITHLAELCMFFIIILVFAILLIAGTCMIAQTVSDCIQHLFKCCFGLSGCLPHDFSSSHIIQLFYNRCLCDLNSLSCHSRLPLQIILDPFLSLHCLKSAFPSCSPPKASWYIASRAMLPTLRPFLPPSLSDLHSLDDVVMWTALSICRICPLQVKKSSFSDHWPLCRVLTLLLAEMSDVARYGPHGGKLCIKCQGSYVESTPTKRNLSFDRQFIWNSNTNHTWSLNSYRVFCVRSRRCVETNITRCPFRRRISFLYLSNMRYQLLFTSMYPCKQTNKKHRTELLQIAGPFQSPATCSYTQPKNTRVECASWLSFIPLGLVAYYIFLRTFHFSLASSSPFPPQQVMPPHSPQPGVPESESSRRTGGSLNAPLVEAQQQCRHQLVHHNAAIAATKNMAQDAHLKIVSKTICINNREQHVTGCEYLNINVEGSQLTI